MTNRKDTFKIGEVCPTSGVYRIKSHDKCISKEQKEIPLVKGKRFPPCRDCHFEVVWEYVRSA